MPDFGKYPHYCKQEVPKPSTLYGLRNQSAGQLPANAFMPVKGSARRSLFNLLGLRARGSEGSRGLGNSGGLGFRV